MNLPRVRSLFVTLISLIVTLQAIESKAEDYPELKLFPVTPEIESAASKALRNYQPSGKKPRGAINKNGVYVLSGDLFNNGRIYAVVDNADSAIICEWRRQHWRPTWWVNVGMEWKFSKLESEAQMARKSNSTRPFWVMSLQNQRLLAFASFVEKSTQNYFIIALNTKADRIIARESSFGFEPVVKHGYLVTMDASRGRSEWDVTRYSRIHNGKLAVSKSWEQRYPYNNPDEIFWYTAVDEGDTYTILPGDSERGHLADLLILEDDLGVDNQKELDELWDQKDFYARIFFKAKKGMNKQRFEESGKEDLAYVFEKLLGLPRRLYSPGDKLGLREEIESVADIKITGRTDAVKALSPRRRIK